MDNASTVKHLDRALADLKDRRMDHETEWRQIAPYFHPARTFEIGVRPGQLIKRRLTSSIPSVARNRCAAIMAGYLIDPTQPFVLPNVERGLVAAGRPTGLDDASNDYLSNVSWQVFSRMMSAKSGFLASTALICDELVTFGTGVGATLRRRGFGPRYQARPLRSCWIAENDEGEVDTLYYEFTLPLWRVKRRFPNAAYVDGWDDGGDSAQAEARNRQDVTLIHVVEPRGGGRAGAVKEAKPFAEYYACLDKKVVLEEGGYDSFPFSVPRLNRTAGSPYGRGLCWSVLPDAQALAWLQQMTEQGVGLRVAPPVLHPQRMFGKALDRRIGASNAYDAAGLGFQSAREALQKIEVAGDVNVGVEYSRFLTQNIEQGLFTDWMRLRETGQMTAEEVIERRELRLRSMSAFIPGVDRDLMGTQADRTLEIMVAEGQIGRPPGALAGMEVEWDYAGPLARAQQRQQAEAFGKLFELATLASNSDPSAPYVIDFAESLRAAAEAWGAPVGALRSREAVEAHREEAAQRDKDTADLAQAQQAATAMRDGGQGISTLMQAANTELPAAA